MNKKLFTLITAGILSLSLVACSSGDGEKVESGSGAPVEEKKEETPKEEAKQEEVILADDDVVKIVVTEKVNDEVFGPTYKFLIENKSDKKITIQSRDTSIDGVMSEPVFSVDVMPGKKANGDMTFKDVESLDKLKNLEGKLVVLDEDFNDVSSYNITIE